METPARSFIWMLLMVACSSPSGHGQAPRSPDTDVVSATAEEAAETENPTPEADAGSSEVTEIAEESTAPEPEKQDALPDKVAERFVQAGGQKLCEAAVYALNPDWRLGVCEALDGDRAERCWRQRAPIRTFTEKVCQTIIEESLRLDLDPLMVVAVMERESSTGRVSFDTAKRTFNISTDICSLFLSTERIVSREPGPTRWPGTERMAWTYGDDRKINRQTVQVVEERDGGVLVNTCVAGETGLFQLLPNNYRNGTVVQATGRRLVGPAARRRETVLGDPELQARLGCQEIARHRDLFPEAERSPYWNWIGTYNTGSTTRGEKWYEYTTKIAGHYLDICTHGFLRVDGDPLSRMIEDVWPDCGRVRQWLEETRSSRSED